MKKFYIPGPEDIFILNWTHLCTEWDLHFLFYYLSNSKIHFEYCLTFFSISGVFGRTYNSPTLPSGCIVVQKQSVGVPVIDYDYGENGVNQTDSSPTLVVSGRQKPRAKNTKLISIKTTNGKYVIRIGKTNKII